jgi:hypothetical protein
MVTIGELVGCDLSAYPNVQRWIANMKKLKSWDTINEVFSGFVAGTRLRSLLSERRPDAPAVIRPRLI